MPTLAHVPLPLIVTLLLLLLSAKVLGELCERFGTPAMIGEVLAGVILGPSLIHLVSPSPELNVLSELAVFLLIIMAALEISPDEIQRALKPGVIWIALFGFSIPFMSGISVGWLCGYQPIFSLFLGLSIAITALPVTVRILMDLGKLQSEIGKKIITASIFNDVLSLLILGILLDFRGETGSIDKFIIVVGSTLFKLLVFILVLYVTYRLIKFASRKLDFLTLQLDRFLLFLKGKESMFALVMLFVLIFASISELLGIYFIVGAFFGTILIPRTIISRNDFRRVKEAAASISSGFLIPVFFATMGASFSLSAMHDYTLFLILAGTTFVSKILGGYLGGRLSGMKSPDAVILGIGINAGGVMALVIANIALNKSLIDLNLFSILVLIALITTLVTPMLLKIAFRYTDRKGIPAGS